MKHSIQHITVPVAEKFYKSGNYSARAKLDAVVSIINGKIHLVDWKMGEYDINQDTPEDGTPDTNAVEFLEQRKKKFSRFLEQLNVEDLNLSGYLPITNIGSKIAAKWRAY